MKIRYTRKTKVEKVITKIQKKVSKDIDSVNNGGCGVFALFTHIELAKVGLASEIIVLDRGDNSVLNKRVTINKLMNNEAKGISDYKIRDTSFSHCLIKCEDIIFDSDEVYEPSRLDAYDVGTYTLAEMAIAVAVGGWNPTYEREDNAEMQSIISEIIQKDLG
jgi:hypothetical protein